MKRRIKTTPVCGTYTVHRFTVKGVTQGKCVRCGLERKQTQNAEPKGGAA